MKEKNFFSYESYKYEWFVKYEWYDLKAIGCSEKALDNYSNSDFSYWYCENTNTIIETVRDSEYCGEWDTKTFVQWYNEQVDNIDEFNNAF